MKILKAIFLFLLILVVSCSEDTIEPILKGTLNGTVIDKETGEPLTNVKISTSPASSTVFTDSAGTFVLPNITVDTYAVQAELEGFITGFETATLLEGETVSVAFELTVSAANNRPPTTPELLFPEDGATEIPLEVELAWDSTDPNGDAISYIISLRNGTTNETIDYQVEQDTTLVITNLQLATNYFWQVTANDDNNPAVSSEISAFTTLTSPDNPFFFVKKINGNNVIFSGNEIIGSTQGEPDINLYQLTNENLNSFRPKRNNTVNKIAFLRTLGSDTQLFSMNMDGSNVQQISSTIPVTGFRQNEIDFTWSLNGSRLFYPSLDKVYSINSDGSGVQLLYQTGDGSLVSEVDVADFDNDLLLLKTNNLNGYSVRIFTYRISTATEETVILENFQGAAGGISFSADANRVLYFKDLSNSENSIYRIFQARLFIFDILSATEEEISTDVLAGENDVDASFSPSEGGVIFTRVLSNTNASPKIYSLIFNENVNDKLLFNDAFMPDW
ncbi:MAG: hypothetical protein COW66_09450, partial [Flavobacteriaceae bacterium CG18_big_fil_WC_8_21_14_2_50_34_36]